MASRSWEAFCSPVGREKRDRSSCGGRGRQSGLCGLWLRLDETLPPGKAVGREERNEAIGRASVWSPTNLAGSADPSSDPEKDTPEATIAEWVKAFKMTRAQIVDRRCPA